MQLGAEGVFVGSGIFKSSDPAPRARRDRRGHDALRRRRARRAGVARGSARRWQSSRRASSTSEQLLAEPRLVARGAAASAYWRSRATSRRTRACCARSAPSVREVRVPDDLRGLDGLVIPGGESTTMTLGIEREGLAEPLRDFVRAGTPVFGTCAGTDHARPRSPRADGHRAARATRSGARCTPSRRTSRSRASTASPCARCSSARRGCEEHGDGVEVLAEVDGHPVAARQGNMLSTAFHPELAGETALHELFLRGSAKVDDLFHLPRRVGGQRGRAQGGSGARRTPTACLIAAGSRPARSAGGCAARASRRSWRATYKARAGDRAGDRRDHRRGRRGRPGPAPGPSVRSIARPRGTTARSGNVVLDADR